MLVKVWTKSNCVQCEQTKKQLAKFEIDYVEMNLEQDLDQLEAFKEQGLMSAPIVETEVGTWSGFRLDKLQVLRTKRMGEK